MPAVAKRYIANNNVNVYLIDAIDLAAKVGMGKRTNTVLQSAFFALAKVLPAEDALQYMKDAATKSYMKKGQAIVDANHKAIDAGATAFRKFEVPADWATAEDAAPVELSEETKSAIAQQVKNLLEPIDRMDGDSLPVSAFVDCADGQFELGASAYEKRGVAVVVPHWDETKCIQCNQCAYVCPHATIRPFAMTEDEAAAAPEATRTLDAMGPKAKGMKFTMAVSPLDCMGCTNCVKVCPKGALEMVPTEQEMDQQPVWDYMVENVSEKKELIAANVKGSQFKQPYLEFSGSCAGCAETAYARLVTQVAGDRMFISNATGCSSIWGNPAATAPYCKDKDGHGPAWNNSLFEDNAEHGLGMAVGYEAVQHKRRAQGRWPGLDRLRQRRRGLQDRCCCLRCRAREVRLRRFQGDPRRQGLPHQEVLLDLRRRRLGLRHRLRWPGSRPGFRPQRQRLRLRHRGLLQHRWSGLQGLEPGPGRSVRRCR